METHKELKIELTPQEVWARSILQKHITDGIQAGRIPIYEEKGGVEGQMVFYLDEALADHEVAADFEAISLELRLDYDQIWELYKLKVE